MAFPDDPTVTLAIAMPSLCREQNTARALKRPHCRGEAVGHSAGFVSNGRLGDDDTSCNRQSDRRLSAAGRARDGRRVAGRTDLQLPPQAWRGPRRARCNPRSHRAGAGASDGGEGQLSHEVLGSFTRRIAPARAGRAAENIAYGYESFEKTLGQWIDFSGHRKNLLLHNASRVGIASARDASSKRTYWAMVIAGDYEPKPGKGEKGKEPVVAVKRETYSFSSGRSKSGGCTIKVLSLCI